MSRDAIRHTYTQTNGREAYLYNVDIAAVLSVQTQKHGPCLLLRIRQSDDIWIPDTPEHRALLDIPPRSGRAKPGVSTKVNVSPQDSGPSSDA